MRDKILLIILVVNLGFTAMNAIIKNQIISEKEKIIYKQAIIIELLKHRKP